jgi:hypothetical protein
MSFIKSQIKKIKIETLPDDKILVTYFLDSNLYTDTINPLKAIYVPK